MAEFETTFADLGSGRADILPGNPYLIPAVAQFLTKRRELCGQRPNGFSPRFHTKVDAAAKSL